ncbi:hypothetical protein Ancab_023662 [Ancistrocladus abbreviatus]
MEENRDRSSAYSIWKMGNCFGQSKPEEKEQLEYHPLEPLEGDDNRDVADDDHPETVNPDNIPSSVGKTPTSVETSEAVEIESEDSGLEKSKQPLGQTSSSPSKDEHMLHAFKVKTLDTGDDQQDKKGGGGTKPSGAGGGGSKSK